MHNAVTSDLKTHMHTRRRASVCIPQVHSTLSHLQILVSISQKQSNTCLPSQSVLTCSNRYSHMRTPSYTCKCVPSSMQVYLPPTPIHPQTQMYHIPPQKTSQQTPSAGTNPQRGDTCVPRCDYDLQTPCRLTSYNS